MARLSTLTMTGVTILCLVLALPTTRHPANNALEFAQGATRWQLESRPELRRISRWQKELQSARSQSEGAFDVRCKFIFVPNDRR